MHDTFLRDIYTSPEAEKYFSDIVGEDVRWLSNTWDASHMNIQVGLVSTQLWNVGKPWGKQ